MKISILSMQRVNNYGSVLQAYALKKIVASLGNEVEFTDILIKPEDKELLGGFYQSYREEYIVSNGIWEKITNKDENSILRGLLKAICKKYQRHLIDKFAKKELKLDNCKCSHYDCCIIGSDEVFNCLQDSEWGYTSQLFGNVDNANKVITYAASCGTATIEETPEKVAASIKDSLRNVYAISVRDIGTQKYIKAYTTKEIFTHLDPVAVCNFDDEIATCKIVLPKKYCIVYSYDNRINDKNIINEISRICDRDGIEIVSVFGTQRWIKHHLTLSPFEVLKAFKGAEMIITDTFHGTLFATKYGKRLAVLIKGSNKNKLSDLVERLSIQEHLVTDASVIEGIVEKPLQRDRIDTLLKQERIRTIEYLEQNLKE